MVMMFKRYRIRAGGLMIGAMMLLMGCAHAPMPYKAPIAASPPSGNVAVSHAVNVLDASGSHETLFADSRATFESIISVMPNGSYSSGSVVFGGFDREATGQSRFDRGVLAASAKNATYLEGASPIFDVIENDVAGAIGDSSGRAAVVLVSDGLATDYVGRGGVDGRAIDAARDLASSRSGETCFHTIQVGNDPAGASFLESLAGVSSCGSSRNAASLSSAGALQQFSRDVYLGGAAPRAKAAPKSGADSDRDGVLDSADACPNTLKNARVDSRGCWTLSGIRFATNSDTLAADSSSTFEEAVAVLRSNPTVRVRIDGHTDSDGSADYNQSLSERRATAVREYFVEEGGLDRDRFEVKGFGESSPAVPNSGAENKRRNRRVELTVIN